VFGALTLRSRPVVAAAPAAAEPTAG
jgi:hypothetical protein